jgi:hypothetical protein
MMNVLLERSRSDELYRWDVKAVNVLFCHPSCLVWPIMVLAQTRFDNFGWFGEAAVNFGAFCQVNPSSPFL